MTKKNVFVFSIIAFLLTSFIFTYLNNPGWIVSKIFFTIMTFELFIGFLASNIGAKLFSGRWFASIFIAFTSIGTGCIALIYIFPASSTQLLAGCLISIGLASLNLIISGVRYSLDK